MPTAPPSRCTEPGCGEITDHGRCEKHQRKPWANTSANGRMLSGRQRETIRTRQLRKEPVCAGCGATEDLQADHIIEVADGGSLTDPSNLQTLCGTCHDIKTAAHRAYRATRRASPIR